jgi:hypothetical protein
VRAHDSPLARPVFADALAAVHVAALHAIGPDNVIGECVKHTFDVSRVEAGIDGPKNRDVVSHRLAPHDEVPGRETRQNGIAAP